MEAVRTLKLRVSNGESKQGLVAHGSAAASIMPGTNTEENESAVVYL